MPLVLPEKNSSFQGIERQVPISEIMKSSVIKLDVSSSVLDVANVMIENGVGSIILTKNKEAVGIITERDIVEKVTTKNITPEKVKAEEIMSSPIISAEPSTSVIDASGIMVKSNIRRLAVANGGDIVGIITVRDILTISPVLNTILENLIEMNEETSVPDGKENGRGICQRCGAYVDVLTEIGGLMLCEDCMDDEGYFD
jgi:CBS domain-containing protein